MNDHDPLDPPSRWISVEDGLPVEGDLVIVAIDTDPSDPEAWDMAVMYRYQHWCWRGESAQIRDDGVDLDGLRNGHKVTHWQPTPEPPEK